MQSKIIWKTEYVAVLVVENTSKKTERLLNGKNKKASIKKETYHRRVTDSTVRDALGILHKLNPLQ